MGGWIRAVVDLSAFELRRKASSSGAMEISGLRPLHESEGPFPICEGHVTYWTAFMDKHRTRQHVQAMRRGQPVRIEYQRMIHAPLFTSRAS